MKSTATEQRSEYSTPDELEEILRTIDPLDPRLEQYRETIDGMDVIRHPLVYAVPYFEPMNAFYNRQLAYKEAQIERYEKSKNYGACLTLFERPHRLGAFLNYCHLMTGPVYWRNLRWIYMDSENLHQDRRYWRMVLTSKRRYRREMTAQEDRMALHEMPKTLTVYRGCSCFDDGGFSWTLSRDKAEWFARRWKDSGMVVLKGTVNKAKVIAYLTSRGEAEIVAMPEDVTITDRRAIS